jgi:hypothetical protein
MESVWLRNRHVWNLRAAPVIRIPKEYDMTSRHWLIIAALTALPILQACGPAVGAAGVIAADAIYEEETGERLF